MHQPIDEAPLWVIWDWDSALKCEVYWTGDDGSLSQGFTQVPDEARLFSSRHCAIETLRTARAVRPDAELGTVDC